MNGIHKLAVALGLLEEPEHWFTVFVEALVSFKIREGHCRVPRSHVEGGYNLGKAVKNIRQAKKGKVRTTLTPEMIQILDDLGFVWEITNSNWFEEDFLPALKKFKKREGHCRVPYSHVEDGYRLGQTVSVIRQAKKGKVRTTLTPEMIQILDDLGFIWDASK